MKQIITNADVKKYEIKKSYDSHGNAHLKKAQIIEPLSKKEGGCTMAESVASFYENRRMSMSPYNSPHFNIIANEEENKEADIRCRYLKKKIFHKFLLHPLRLPLYYLIRAAMFGSEGFHGKCFDKNDDKERRRDLFLLNLLIWGVMAVVSFVMFVVFDNKDLPELKDRVLGAVIFPAVHLLIFKFLRRAWLYITEDSPLGDSTQFEPPLLMSVEELWEEYTEIKRDGYVTKRDSDGHRMDTHREYDPSWRPAIYEKDSSDIIYFGKDAVYYAGNPISVPGSSKHDWNAPSPWYN